MKLGDNVKRIKSINLTATRTTRNCKGVGSKTIRTKLYNAQDPIISKIHADARYKVPVVELANKKDVQSKCSQPNK